MQATITITATTRLPLLRPFQGDNYQTSITQGCLYTKGSAALPSPQGQPSTEGSPALDSPQGHSSAYTSYWPSWFGGAQ